MKKFEIMAYLYDIIWDLTNFFFHLLTFSHDKKEEGTVVLWVLMKEELKFYSRWNLLYELISYSNLPRVHFFTFTRCFLFTDDISMLLNATRIPVTLLKSYFHVLLFCQILWCNKFLILETIFHSRKTLRHWL